MSMYVVDPDDVLTTGPRLLVLEDIENEERREGLRAHAADTQEDAVQNAVKAYQALIDDAREGHPFACVIVDMMYGGIENVEKARNRVAALVGVE